MIDHKATRKALTDQAAAFIANPTGWPAAMAARALRLRAGHPAYSPANTALIMVQIYSQLRASGLSEQEALSTTLLETSGEIAPKHVWGKRGFTPTGRPLHIWSRPMTLMVDPETNKKADKDNPNAVARRIFRIEDTFRAADVVDANGQTGAQAYAVPDLPEGQPREVFERLAAWIQGQGWAVSRSGRDMKEGGYTVHETRQIVIHGGLAEWAAVETLAHEIAHALLHGADDERLYSGEHRGDMEAEAEAVAFGLLTAFGRGDLARGSARYAAEWTRSPERVAVAYERSCHVLDAVAAVAFGAQGVTVARSAKADKASEKARNRELAAALRAAGLQPSGEAWTRAKAGEPIEAIAASLLMSAAA